MVSKKVCFNCRLERNLEDFAYHSKTFDKLQSFCQECSKKEGSRQVEAEQKRCSGCARNLPKADFGARAAGSDGLRTRCRKCCLFRLSAISKRKKMLLNSWKRKGCCRCSVTDIRVIEADHINRETKARSSRGKLRKLQNLSLKELEAELLNCQPLCAWYSFSSSFFTSLAFLKCFVYVFVFLAAID